MILAIESSSSVGSVALMEGGAVVREIEVQTPRGRGGALFTALEEILRSRPALEKVIVGLGPGSYNGIRSAISVGWGIAAARKVPVAGVSSLLGLGQGSYCAIGDARRGQYYFAAVENGRFIVEPVLIEAPELLPSLESFSGRPIFTSSAIAAVPQAEVRHASAVLLAGLDPACEGAAEPLYLKPPHITAPKGA